MEYATSNENTPRGRPMLPIEVRKDIYEFWKGNSIVSVHRSNQMHLVKIVKKNILSNTIGISDPDVEDAKDKLQAHRRIAMKSYKELYKTYTHTSCNTVSYGSFINLKPFYISSPTAKEMEMCLCSACLNLHNLYKAIKSTINTEMPYSLSKYLCKSFKCNPEEDTHFFKLECILRKCENKCKITDIMKDLNLKDDNNQMTSYYIFERMVTSYFNKSGKNVSYTRTSHIDKKEPIRDVTEKLQSVSQKYLLHRYSIVNDKIYWQKFLLNNPHYTLLLDYSQNIAFKEKYQCQSAHFSGRQQTLHNTVLQSPKNGDNTYLYHISDDTNHESIMTFKIINQIIREHPEIIKNHFLVLRSDNRTEQYKCRTRFLR